MLVCSLHFTKNDFTLATNKRRRLKKQAIPSRKIPELSHSTKKTVIDRSKRHWLQKCTLDIFQENMEIEDNENIADRLEKQHETGDVQFRDVAKSSRSSKGQLASNVAPLTDVFYNDKATQSELWKFFQLPQILNSNEKLINFAGINKDVLKTIAKCAERTSNFNECNWPNIEARIILVLCKFKLNISFHAWQYRLILAKDYAEVYFIQRSASWLFV